MRLFIYTLITVLLTVDALAEEPVPSVSDTIHLDEITLYSDYRKYQPGAKFDQISKVQIESTQESNIDQLLMRLTPVYLKSTAGGLSTIRIRGTSPNHTSVNFGGININSLTLGQSNLSSISSFLFDQLEIQMGSSSTLNGSGSIGGAIYLGQQNKWTDGFGLDMKNITGSFGEKLYGAKLFLGNGKLESVSKLYSYRKENDFPFLNPYTGDVENREPFEDIQKGAKINNMGLMQEINYQFTPNEYFKSTFWLEKNWYEIQPNMKNNLDDAPSDAMLSEHIRIWTSYKNENNKIAYTIGSGYVHDFQEYDSIDAQQIITDRFIVEASAKQNINHKLEYKAGLKYKYIVPDVYAFSANNIKQEQHLDFYSSFFYQPIRVLKTTINLRQMFVSNFKVPFTPSLGAEYTLISSDSRMLQFSAALARSHRIPTLNDRFWADQGNPDLLPEEGISIEAGIKYHHSNGENHSTFTWNAFYMDINNWIEWRNFGVWQAQNVQRVISKGIEIHGASHYQLGDFHTDFNLNYTLNPTRAAESIIEGATINHQLIYNPMHMANFYYALKYHSLSANIDGTFTGSRYTNYVGSKLPAYFLTNCGLALKNEYRQQSFTVSFTVHNLFNVSYQNEKYYAMPGRSFRLGLSISLHSNNP
ncbi:TonB-dependent receptor [Roseimarinus sediminis]|uniref:TonB-dependent receptor n=1 Tax=Roseimarinus sediminis TaxID=1610899 RepID=UPI003D1F2D96